MSTSRLVRILAPAVWCLPVARRELYRALLAEAAAAESMRDRAGWLWGAACFVVKEGIMGWLRRAAIGGSALFILWIVYNGIDSGFQGTPVQIAAYLGLLSLLTVNIVVLTRAGTRHRDAD
ncbi:hypothetical protein [Embleya sp. AB8]|uniref:hypothetical protein n=1 Tax=Embleya sp. AB8 TaxID=3156304 RepID=UPI003C765798